MIVCAIGQIWKMKRISTYFDSVSPGNGSGGGDGFEIGIGIGSGSGSGICGGSGSCSEFKAKEGTKLIENIIPIKQKMMHKIRMDFIK